MIYFINKNGDKEMFEKLEKTGQRPGPYEFYTAELLWNDEYVSKKMLEFHLNENVDPASRNKTFLDKSASWIISRFNIGTDTKICDFGCGPGLYTAPFAEKGAHVTGIDFSTRSIQYAKDCARSKNLNIDYILQNYLNFTTDKRFDLITLIYEDFCPLSPEQRKSLLGIFHDCLENDGAVLLDVLSMNHFNETNEKSTFEYSPDNGFWSPHPYYEFCNTFKYQEEKVVLYKYTVVEKTQTREIFNWLQSYSLESLKKEFQDNGFDIVEYYSDVTGAPYKSDSKDIAIIAKKI